MRSFYGHAATSQDSRARWVRKIYCSLSNFSLPVPHLIFRPLLVGYLLVRQVYYFVVRILICEPFLKAYCTKYGRNVHTGVFIHWIQGQGRLVVGDDVTIDGKCSFIFAVRYSEQPSLLIGDHVRIGHNSSFTVGREIRINNHVMIAENVQMFDSPGHPTDPNLRLAGSPALPEDVKPICIEENVWIGSNAIIYPGITIGENSVVASGAIVMSNVAPNVVVAGSPARIIAQLHRAKE